MYESVHLALPTMQFVSLSDIIWRGVYVNMMQELGNKRSTIC